MTAFDDLLALEPGEPGVFRTRLEPSWCQGRTAFGGLTAAWAVEAMTRAVDDPDRQLIGLDVAFVAPLSPGPVEVAASVLRAGRNASHVEARVSNAGGDTSARVHGIFGRARPSDIVSPAAAPAPTVVPGDLERMPYVNGLTPAFTQHFDLRVSAGAYPFTGSAQSSLAGYARHRTPVRGTPATVALLDAWWCPALAMGQRPFFASSMRWSANFACPLPALTSDFVYYESAVEWSGAGYATAVARLYQGGALLAWSEQLVALFDG